MKKMSKRAKIVVFALAAAAAALLTAYFIGKNYFAVHFLPGTVINGIDCGGDTAREVKDKLQDTLLDYSLELRGRGGKTEVITAGQLGVEYTDDGGVERLLEEQKETLWFLAVTGTRKHETAADFTYSSGKLDQVLADLSCFDPQQAVPPKDAYVEDDGSAFVVIPEQEGTTLDPEKTRQAVREAVESGAAVLDLEEEALYLEPAVWGTDPELQAEAQLLNTMTRARITYDFSDRQKTVDRDTIKSWLTRGEDGSYFLDREKAAEWVRQMAYDTDTFGLEHEFKTSLGPTITLAAGGDYGWVIDRDATTEELIRLLEAGETATVEPVYLYEGKDRSVNDIGDTYAEICITQQRMWCYKDGQLIADTPVVTGCHSTGYDTPSGSVWAIDAKKANAHFSTYNSDVDFWLPFNGDVGIHDASWRAEGTYGGDVWLNGGSHGCINTPYNAAQAIFQVLEIGDPVIVYYSTDQPVGPSPTQELEMG